MNPNEYQKLAARTECDQDQSQIRIVLHHNGGGGWPDGLSTRLNHAVLGITGEAGELAGAIEKWLYYGQSLDDTNVVEELGDLMWYIALACNSLGVNLEDVMEVNIAKLKKRYPENYSDHHAAEENRDRNAEREILEQNGQGWAEPAELPPEAEAVFGDGLVREDNERHISSSYTKVCELCGKPVYKDATPVFYQNGLIDCCTDCYVRKVRM